MAGWDIYNQTGQLLLGHCLEVLANRLDVPVVMELPPWFYGRPTLLQELVHAPRRALRLDGGE